jgi:putative transposase
MARFVVREGWVVQAYRYALDPSPRQERALASHAGAARVAYNWAVTWVLATWAQRKAEESYGVPEDERTPWRGWSLPAALKQEPGIPHGSKTRTGTRQLVPADAGAH